LSEPVVDDLLYLDDFTVGQVIEMGPRLVTEEEIVEFAREFDPQPFHTDRAAAAQSPFGGIVASGWHTIAICMRLMVDGYIGRAASMGSPGVDSARWLKPVRPGDSLTLRTQVQEIKPSRSKPDRGILRTEWNLVNQHGETVMTMIGMGMYRRRAAANRYV
jgi:acyl dehydratase